MGDRITTRNHSIDYLKAICAIFVILHHSISHISGEYGCYLPTWIKIITSPIYVHVPLFFVVGGGLCHQQPLKKYYSKKVRRILVPFFFFTALKLIYTAFISDKFAHSDSIVGQLYEGFVLGNMYWFSYTIFVFYCIAPILWRKKDNKPILCLAVFITSLVFNIIDSNYGLLDNTLPFQLNSVVKYLPFFTLGLLLQDYKEHIEKLKALNKSLVIVAAVALYSLLYYLAQSVSFFTNYFFWFVRLLSVMVFLYEIVDGLNENIIVRKISDYSYQLMLVDSFFRVIILIVISKLFTLSYMWILPQTIMSVICGVVVCEILSKTKVLKFLFGL